MKIIKHFKGIKEAEKFQWKLYDRYKSVKLTGWPFNGEAGNYVFEVSDDIEKISEKIRSKSLFFNRSFNL